jgi:hypothetical protein
MARRLSLRGQLYRAAVTWGTSRPMYHLTTRSDRIKSLREASRVVRPDGVVAVAAISRFASLCDGLARGFFFDPGSAKSSNAISPGVSTAIPNMSLAGSRRPTFMSLSNSRPKSKTPGCSARTRRGRRSYWLHEAPGRGALQTPPGRRAGAPVDGPGVGGLLPRGGA